MISIAGYHFTMLLYLGSVRRLSAPPRHRLRRTAAPVDPPKTKIWLSGPWIILCPNLSCFSHGHMAEKKCGGHQKYSVFFFFFLETKNKNGDTQLYFFCRGGKLYILAESS